MSSQSLVSERARELIPSQQSGFDSLLKENLQRELGGEWQALSKPNLGTRQRWRWQPENSKKPVFVKKYAGSPLRDQIDQLIRPRAFHSRAWWEFEQCGKLAESEIAAPEPLAVAERMNGLIERDSALIVGQVAGEALDRAWLAAKKSQHAMTRGWARF